MRAAACGIALFLLAAGLLRADGAFFAAALPFAAFAVWGVLTGPPSLELAASRQLSARLVPIGTLVEVTLTVTNRGPRIEALALEDVLPKELAAVEGRASWQGTLDPGAEIVFRYTVKSPRGSFTFRQLRAEAEDPCTCMKTRAMLPCPVSLAVHPRTCRAPNTSFGASSARPFSGRSRTKRAGTGTDFAGTREYTPGDPLRHLNWRAEALWGRPMVNVFEEERAIDVGIILDCRCEAYDSMEGFEAAVGAALAMAEDLLDRGHRVAFLNYGSLISWTPSGSGREQRLRLRLAAARATLGAHAAFDRFDNLPVRIFPPRSMVLLVSPLRREDVAPLRSLKALGYEVAVLRPDPLSQGVEATPDPVHRLANRILGLEGDVLSSRLLGSGITLLDWKTAEPLGALRVHAGGHA